MCVFYCVIGGKLILPILIHDVAVFRVLLCDILYKELFLDSKVYILPPIPIM